MRNFDQASRGGSQPDNRALAASHQPDYALPVYLNRIAHAITLSRAGENSVVHTVKELLKQVGLIVREVEYCKSQQGVGQQDAEVTLYQAVDKILEWVRSIRAPLNNFGLTYLCVLVDRVALDSCKYCHADLAQQHRAELRKELKRLVNPLADSKSLKFGYLKLAAEAASFSIEAADSLDSISAAHATEYLEHTLLANLRRRAESLFKLLDIVKSNPVFTQTWLADDTTLVALEAATDAMTYSLKYSRLHHHRACSALVLPYMAQLSDEAVQAWWRQAFQALASAESNQNFAEGFKVIEQCHTAMSSLPKHQDLQSCRLDLAAHEVRLLAGFIVGAPKGIGRRYVMLKNSIGHYHSLLDREAVETSEPYKRNAQRVISQGIKGHLAAVAAFYKAGSTTRAERAKSEAIREFKRLRDICVEGDVGDNIRLAHDALSISRGLFLSDAGGTQLNPDRWLRVAWLRLQTALNAPNNAGDAYSLQLMHLRSRLAKIALMIGCRASFKVLSTDLKAACHELNHRIADQVANPVKVGAKVELQNLGQISVDLYSHWAALNHLAYGADRAVKPLKAGLMAVKKYGVSDRDTLCEIYNTASDIFSALGDTTRAEHYRRLSDLNDL